MSTTKKETQAEDKPVMKVKVKETQEKPKGKVKLSPVDQMVALVRGRENARIQLQNMNQTKVNLSGMDGSKTLHLKWGQKPDEEGYITVSAIRAGINSESKELKESITAFDDSINDKIK